MQCVEYQTHTHTSTGLLKDRTSPAVSTESFIIDLQQTGAKGGTETNTLHNF